MKKHWTVIKPVLVLTLICVITSGLLAVTNAVTAPIIAANQLAAQNATKIALLPAADDFEELDISELKGVTSAFKATNDVGYIVTGSSSGYDGQLPVTVAFDNDGNIVAVEIANTNETPGLGKKVEEESFKSQFAGMKAEPKTISDIDAISGATISSNAVVAALNNAIEAYKVFTGTAEEKVDPKLLLMPDATGFTELDASGYENVTAIWKEDSGIGYIIIGWAEGYHGQLPVMVAFDQNNMIIGVEIYDTEETPGLGKQVEEEFFKSQFAGMAAEPFTLKDIDAIADATISSKAVKDAINSAIEAYKAFAVATEATDVSDTDDTDASEVTEATDVSQIEEEADPKLLLMPDAAGFTELDASGYENVTAIWKEDSGIGYIIVGWAEGYHGQLPVMVAFDQNDMIIGVEISDTEETPGLGKQVEEESFKSQFAGMKAEPFTLKDIDAIADATISSKAVKDAINSAIEAYHGIKGVE